MSHSTAVRRRLPAVLLTALTAVLCLALFAAPATAADEAADGAAAEGFGTGQWDGMILAAIIGTVMAGVTFSMSRPGDIEKVAEGHH